MIKRQVSNSFCGVPRKNDPEQHHARKNQDVLEKENDIPQDYSEAKRRALGKK